MSLLIKNGRIITADADYVADIFIDGAIVHTIGRNLPVNADDIIDATGKLVFPGGIDPHVHLDMPFMGTFSSIIMKQEQEQHCLAALQWSSILFYRNKE
jgi:dihydropyrimidinase